MSKLKLFVLLALTQIFMACSGQGVLIVGNPKLDCDTCELEWDPSASRDVDLNSDPTEGSSSSSSASESSGSSGSDTSSGDDEGNGESREISAEKHGETGTVDPAPILVGVALSDLTDGTRVRSDLTAEDEESDLTPDFIPEPPEAPYDREREIEDSFSGSLIALACQNVAECLGAVIGPDGHFINVNGDCQNELEDHFWDYPVLGIESMEDGVGRDPEVYLDGDDESGLTVTEELTEACKSEIELISCGDIQDNAEIMPLEQGYSGMRDFFDGENCSKIFL